MTFILASKSPRRREILKKINLNFKIHSSELDEKNIINNYKYLSSYCKNLAIKNIAYFLGIIKFIIYCLKK